MLIVVTGGIGTGKSTVSQALAEAMPGYELVSADQMVRDLYAQSEPFQKELIHRFGTTDRKKVARIAFSDAAIRSDLVALSWQYLAGHVDALFERDDVIFEFPLYCESPRWHGKPAIVIVLSCAEITQRDRVMARDGISSEQYERIRSSQRPLAQKLKLADFHLNTSGPMDSVLNDVQALPTKLYAMGARHYNGLAHAAEEKAQQFAGQEGRIS